MADRAPLVVITGGSGGIGAAAARAVARDGFGVVLAARRREAIEDLSRALTIEGHNAVAVTCDISSDEQVRSLADEVLGLDRPVRALINNAGVIDPIGLIGSVEPQAWARALAINTVGAFHMLQAMLPPLLADGGGVLVNISSGAAHMPLEGWSAYCASKAGLAMLTRSAHLELAGSGLRVYGFQPGIVDTDMQATIRASGINRVSTLPRETLLPPEDPARIIAWLIREAPQDLAGQEFRADDAQIRRRAGLE